MAECDNKAGVVGKKEYAPQSAAPKAAAESARVGDLQLIFAAPHVLEVALNRPTKRNALTTEGFFAIGGVFDAIARHATGVATAKGSNAGSGSDYAALALSFLAGKDIRCVVLSGSGPGFCSGIDLSTLADGPTDGEDPARTAVRIAHVIAALQRPLSLVADCPVPVVAAIHGTCFGAGVDLVCSADIRLCSADATFCVKEVDLGLAADIGTLQRLPVAVGSASVVNDWCLTARVVGSDEAARVGFVSGVAADAAGLRADAFRVASVIASKSPVAIYGTKETLRFNTRAREDQGLRRVAVLNSALLQSGDMAKAMAAGLSKKKAAPAFSKL